MASALLEVLADGLEKVTGRRIVDADRYELLEDTLVDYGDFARDTQNFAETVIENYDNFTGNTKYEPNVVSRRAFAKQARKAFERDPLASAEIDTKTNFSFGRGVSKPTAQEKKVQELIDKAWKDPVNVNALTGFEAQRMLSATLSTEANIYAVGNTKNANVRVEWLNSDNVIDVVRHPKDRTRILYYVVEEVKTKWDFDHDKMVPDGDGKKTKVYYAHWQNVQDAIDNDEDIPVPPAGRLREGLVYHLRINRLMEQSFGQPPLRRTLRFYSAMNRFTEARVSMALASAQLIARRVVSSGRPGDVMKQASALYNRTGDIGSNLRAITQGADGVTNGLQTPMSPASILHENSSISTEPISLNSGAGNAAQDVQVLRAPIAASSGFGQHVFGDAQNAGSLAAATALELPTMMMINAWQEGFEQLFRWFIDLVIDTGMKEGALGLAKLSESEGRPPLHTLSLWEDKEEIERRLDKKLSYEFQMPYPGRRNLPDVVDAVTQIAQSFDPNGENNALRREMLTVLFTMGFEREDPARIVDEIWPENMVDQTHAEVQPIDPNDPNADPRAKGGADGQMNTSGKPADQASTYGEKKQGAVAEEYMPPELRALMESATRGGTIAFESLVSAPGQLLSSIDGAEDS